MKLDERLNLTDLAPQNTRENLRLSLLREFQDKKSTHVSTLYLSML